MDIVTDHFTISNRTSRVPSDTRIQTDPTDFYLSLLDIEGDAHLAMKLFKNQFRFKTLNIQSSKCSSLNLSLGESVDVTLKTND